ncbi:MAG: hypothetical protein R2860_16440 [Desulfobacterales bacterium]
MLFILSASSFSGQKAFKTTVAVITWLAAFLALLGIVEFITESLDYPQISLFYNNKLFWLRELT